jgi:CTP-dependent riboflavin kinase
MVVIMAFMQVRIVQLNWIHVSGVGEGMYYVSAMLPEPYG